MSSLGSWHFLQGSNQRQGKLNAVPCGPAQKTLGKTIRHSKVLQKSTMFSFICHFRILQNLENPAVVVLRDGPCFMDRAGELTRMAIIIQQPCVRVVSSIGSWHFLQGSSQRQGKLNAVLWTRSEDACKDHPALKGVAKS